MSKSITIKKIQGKILSYKKDGKTYRLYDNILNDDFIKEYISNGTDEEIAERKKMFNFPVEEAEEEKKIDNKEALSKQIEASGKAIVSVKKRGRKAKNG